MKSSLVALGTLFLAGVAAPAAAQELVANGGFESGSLAPFTLTAAPGGAGNSSNVGVGSPHSGAYKISGYDNGAGGSDYAQVLTTAAGGTYSVTVWARATSAAAGNSIQLGLGGATSAVFPLTTTYQQYSFTTTAASTSDAVHVFAATCGGCGNYLFDDVSVQLSAPPPATVPTLSEWAMIGFGSLLAALGGFHVIRRRYAV